MATFLGAFQHFLFTTTSLDATFVIVAERDSVIAVAD